MVGRSQKGSPNEVDLIQKQEKVLECVQQGRSASILRAHRWPWQQVEMGWRDGQQSGREALVPAI